MTSEIGSRRDAHEARGATIAGTRAAARRSRAVRRNRRIAMLRIGLGLLRSRQLHAQVITGIIGLAALAGIAREDQARAVTRLAAWNQQQTLRLQRKTKTRPA